MQGVSESERMEFFVRDVWYEKPVSYTHLDVYKRQRTHAHTHQKNSLYIRLLLFFHNISDFFIYDRYDSGGFHCNVLCSRRYYAILLYIQTFDLSRSYSANQMSLKSKLFVNFLEKGF